MGRYINQDSRGNELPALGKVVDLLGDGATRVDGKTFVPNLVCVVDNGHFEAAAYCFNEREYQAFSNPADYRPKEWLIYEHADKLAVPKTGADRR